MLCSNFILEASPSHKTWPINRCMTGQEEAKAKAQSNTLIPLFPVLWVRIMPWKQTIRQRQTQDLWSVSQAQKAANTPQLAGLESTDDFIGWAPLKGPFTILSSLSRAQRFGCQTQKQLEAETLQEQHKSDLNGSCILFRQENPSDIVMFSALYSNVDMEMEVIWWKEKGGGGWTDGKQNMKMK